MSKTKEELMQYATKMRQRGDSYAEIKMYLERNTDNEQTVNEIISVISELEKVAKPIQEKEELPVRNIILGSCFISLGIFLLVFLWGQGLIAVLPFIMIAIGVNGIISPYIKNKPKKRTFTRRFDF